MRQETRILECVTSDYTWEQIIYDIVGWEGLDPWDIDISALSESFLVHMNEMKDFDFHVPSKYVIVATMLLRMKAGYIEYIQDEVEKAHIKEEEMIEEEIASALEKHEDEILQVASIEVPPRRKPTRKIVLTELVNSLKRAFDAQARKEDRKSVLRKRINIKSDEITQKITSLYERINDILGRMDKDEMHFSDLVMRWDRDNIVNTFLPVIYLDNQKKIEATQKEMFEDILIRKRFNGEIKKNPAS